MRTKFISNESYKYDTTQKKVFVVQISDCDGIRTITTELPDWWGEENPDWSKIDDYELFYALYEDKKIIDLLLVNARFFTKSNRDVDSSLAIITRIR